MTRRWSLIIFVLCTLGVFFSASPILAVEETVENAIIPNLSIDIPGVSFSEVLKENGVLQINFIGDYVSGIYKYLLGIAITIAIVFIMVAGLQYALASGEGDTKKAKDRIQNAVMGLVLLLCVYAILFITNPELIKLRSLQLLDIEQLELDRATSGDEGVSGSVSRSTCDKIVETAKSEGTCAISQSVASPTGNQPGCGNHHWYDGGANGDYKKINNLDYAAGWGTPILAPFDGTATYKISTSTSNRCGNTITLTEQEMHLGQKSTSVMRKIFSMTLGSTRQHGP